MSKKETVKNFDELKESLLTYLSEDDVELIAKAHDYAFTQHLGQKRLTGEDYILHPLNVASILVDIKADATTICAALLHDIIEDCGITRDQIVQEFSEEIAVLVDGVTKINKLSFSAENEAVSANHRKILVGLSEDVRVIFIKLADRLHNMRTLWALPEKRQKAKARETLEILTPIAHRLGIGSIKSELEDLSLRYYKPDVYFDIVERLNQSKTERDNIVIDMKETVSEILNNHGLQHEIKGRAKSIYSIFKKLDAGRKWNDIYDLLALRVYVNTEEECYKALGLIHAKFRPIPKRFKDYVAMPKSNMYQSLHTTVFGLDGFLFEIQIRTYEMDKIAELGIAAHWSYKEQGSGKIATMQDAMEQKLQFFRTMMEIRDDENNDEEFARVVREDILQDNIYVFTPKGDVLELPLGSTPIDFAYRVHSDVGDKMVGAIVNGNIVPFDYVLKNDDIVKINCNKNSFGPNREWIDIAHTQQAKNKIKSFFNRIDKSEYLKKGEELLQKELRKRKVTYATFEENQNKIFTDLKIGSLDELYISLGNGKFTPTQITNIISGENISKEELILNKVSTEVAKPVVSKNDVVVDGIDDIKINIASCCKPLPGDKIVGYITKGYGITVHRMICPNVEDLEERIISVHWNENTTKKYPTGILVYAIENTSLLLDIIAKTANLGITVQSVNTITVRENFLFDLTILVENDEILTKFMNEIEQMPKVIDVERAIK